METCRFTFDRDVPILRDTDILVVGGGPAGLAAAVCAARRSFSRNALCALAAPPRAVLSARS